MFKKTVISLSIVALTLFSLFVIKKYIGNENEEIQNITSLKNNVMPLINQESQKQVQSVDHHAASKQSDSSNLELEIQVELKQLLNTSSEGLVEIKTDNGEMVDLKDRFRTVPVATINDRGEVVIQDYVSPPDH